MQRETGSPGHWFSRPTLHPVRALWLRRLDAACQIAGFVAIVSGHGLQAGWSRLPWPLELLVWGCWLCIAVGIALRYRWSLAKVSFSERHRHTVWAVWAWLVSLVGGAILPLIWNWDPESSLTERIWNCWAVSAEFLLLGYACIGFVRGLRKAASGWISPAHLLVLSFGLLIVVGTILLMLPMSRRQNPETPEIESAPFLTALFTATSASCVTGLVVEETGTYWSRTGQIVILSLFQIGGLGIMTFGAFFAVIAGRKARVSEVATIRDLLATEAMGDVRRLVTAIASFTFGTELLGAVLLLPHFHTLPWPERIYQSLFHSVSAFCNAGFSLTPNSFVGEGTRWTVWGVIACLIMIGGLGFAVLYNVYLVLLARLRRSQQTMFESDVRPVRLTLTAKLVLITTGLLLMSGTVLIYVLEHRGADGRGGIHPLDAWFQSVTLRTAGFNTVDFGEWRPATKLLAIFLMLIGASPGSTGGGIKTVVFAIAMLGLLSVLRGRDRVESFGRTIPVVTVNRALAIFFVSLATTLVTTLLIVMFENRPEWFLDHLFEATSAVGTVGVSSSVPLDDQGGLQSVTRSLTGASRLVIIVAMFLGRIGPLTLLLALAGEAPTVRYEYPQERVLLG